ncbi:MAG: S41 family peptidase [Cardiobacteriaceae bacterium]|nr:S41 family peptidase [Cardiobacteriaceae bacterium]
MPTLVHGKGHRVNRYALALLGFFTITKALYAQQERPQIPPKINLTSIDEPKDDAVPHEALKTFVDVFDAVKTHYLEEVNNQQLIERAIRGMLVRLDPHSAYLNAEELEHFEQLTSGQFTGVGLDLDIKAGAVRIVSAIEGSPAARAGLQSGDIINQINGKNITDLNLEETSQLLMGEVGKEVKLIIQRGESISEYTLVREVIQSNSVSSRMLTEQFAYLRITQFQDDTADKLRKEVEALRVKHNITGWIIDLRQNPGGYLDSALAVSDLFLHSGIIVQMRGRNPEDNAIYEASEGDFFEGQKVVVVVDEGSASAAEIFAAAMKDHKRGIVVGQTTFGKGSVQTVLNLNNGGAVKLTTSRYYSPNGDAIQGQGVTPHITLNPLTVKTHPQSGENQRESALPYYLSSGTEPSNVAQSALPTPNNMTAKPLNQSTLAEQDFALYEAVNILQTAVLMSGQP